MNVYPWNEEREALLRKCLAEGLSSGQAAKRINAETGAHFTRNAIIGKVIRLGIHRPTSASKPRTLSAPPLKVKPPKNPLGAKHRLSKPNQDPCVFGKGMKLKAPEVSVPKSSNNGLNFGSRALAPGTSALPKTSANSRAYDQTSRKLRCEELTSATCKFGTHEEGGENRFCGHAVKAGSVYCASHHARSYTGVPKKLSSEPEYAPSTGRGGFRFQAQKASAA